MANGSFDISVPSILSAPPPATPAPAKTGSDGLNSNASMFQAPSGQPSAVGLPFPANLIEFGSNELGYQGNQLWITISTWLKTAGIWVFLALLVAIGIIGLLMPDDQQRAQIATVANKAAEAGAA